MIRSTPSSRARRAASAAADAAVDRDDQLHALGVQPFDRRRLQAVAVAQPLGNEVDDVAAEHLERAPQDHGGGDAVDVVVAVDRDPLAPRERPLEPLDRRVHAGEPERIVQVIERRVAGSARRGSGSPKPRMHSSRATVGCRLSAAASAVGLRVVARQVLPEQRLHAASLARGMAVRRLLACR